MDEGIDGIQGGADGAQNELQLSSNTLRVVRAMLPAFHSLNNQAALT